VPFLFGDEQTYGLKGEVRRDWEVRLRYGVRMNHIITLESIEFSLYIYLDYEYQYFNHTRKIVSDTSII
jgi:hypothetical protein